MSYSLDLRIRVVEFVEQGGGVSEAAKVFKVGRSTIYRWLAREDLKPTVVKERQGKLDKEALRKDVEENPDAKLADRAQRLGVKTNTVWYALKKMKITRKKTLRYKERKREERIEHYRKLRELIKKYGSENVIDVDESGFKTASTCPYARSKRGRKVYGEQQGKREQRETLVAGRRKKKKDLIAPMLFTGSLDAAGFETWRKECLLPELKESSVLMLDSAPMHRKTAIQELVEAAGHQVLFLPRYSPDLNVIEHDFSALKRVRMCAEPGTSIDEIIRDYCAA